MPRPVSADVATIGASGSTRRDRRAHVLLDEREPLVVDEIGLRERDDAAPHAEQLENREMLARLRHHAFVGGDDEQREIDSRRAGDHRAHERLVTRDVDDADRADPLEHERREAELDRDAAPLLFGQSIGVDAGQRANERRLAVIDVPRGADDHAGSSARAERSSRSHDVERAQRAIVGEMLAQELAQQPLMRARFLHVGERMRRRRRASRAVRRAPPAAAFAHRARGARTARQSTPPAGWLNIAGASGVDRRVTLGAVVDRRRNAQLGRARATRRRA